MPRRQGYLPPPANPLDPAIVQGMTIPVLDVPEYFEEHFTEEEVNKMRDMDVRDVSIATRFSRLAQANEWLIGVVALQNQQLRIMEAAQVKRKREEWGAIKWLMATGLAGIIMTVLSYFKK